MSEPQSPAKLSVVEPSSRRDAASAADAGEPAARRSRLTWLAVAAAVLFSLLWLGQHQRANELDGQVSVLSGELAGARAELAAYELRIAEARSRVQGLAEDLASLGELLGDETPSEPAPAD